MLYSARSTAKMTPHNVQVSPFSLGVRPYALDPVGADSFWAKAAKMLGEKYKVCPRLLLLQLGSSRVYTAIAPDGISKVTSVWHNVGADHRRSIKWRILSVH